MNEQRCSMNGSLMKPNTGNSNCDTFIKETFRREVGTSAMTGSPLQKLRIMPIQNEVVLTEDQFMGLIQYLRNTFCCACNGSGFDPDTLDGRCEYCNDNIPC